jgi:hypothetical protein
MFTQPLLPWKSNSMQSASFLGSIILLSMACWTLQYFSTLSQNSTIYGKRCAVSGKYDSGGGMSDIINLMTKTR